MLRQIVRNCGASGAALRSQARCASTGKMKSSDLTGGVDIEQQEAPLWKPKPLSGKSTDFSLPTTPVADMKWVAFFVRLREIGRRDLGSDPQSQKPEPQTKKRTNALSEATRATQGMGPTDESIFVRQSFMNSLHLRANQRGIPNPKFQLSALKSPTTEANEEVMTDIKRHRSNLEELHSVTYLKEFRLFDAVKPILELSRLGALKPTDFKKRPDGQWFLISSYLNQTLTPGVDVYFKQQAAIKMVEIFRAVMQQDFYLAFAMVTQPAFRQALSQIWTTSRDAIDWDKFMAVLECGKWIVEKSEERGKVKKDELKRTKIVIKGMIDAGKRDYMKK